MTKNMKIFNKVIVIISLLFVFNACSKSADDNNGSDTSELISILKSNKWIMRDASYGEGDKDHAWLDVEHTTLYFTSNREGVVYWVQRDYDTDLGNHKTYDYKNFTYTVFGENITLNAEDGTNNLVYSGKFLAEGSNIYEKAAMESGDYELLEKIAPKTGTCGTGMTFIYSPKTHELRISGKGKMKDYTVSSQPWHNYDIESVVIEEGCTYIGKSAFAGFFRLGTIQLPSSILEIGDEAFAETTITKVSIPDNVEIIGSGAFLNCSYLQRVYLSKKLKIIGDGAFAGCAIKHQNLTLPDNVEEVGDNAFAGWQAGTLTLNEGLKIIGMSAFIGVNGTVKIPNSVESIGFLAFDGAFSKVVIGTGLKKLSKGAFGGSLSSGSMYVNLGVPLDVEGDIMASDNQYRWTLYVPKGSKNVYKANQYWRGFKSIIEDKELVSGNGAPDETNKGEDHTGKDEGIKVDYKNLTYKINGKEFKMIRVDGGSLKPYYMMQTELPPDGQFQIGDFDLGMLNKLNDGGVIKSEVRQFLEKIYEVTGLVFRLPTTAEWKFAAAGGSKTKKYVYSGSNDIDEVGWYVGNCKAVHDIALKKPNELGFYDMSGNYQELCNDTEEDIYLNGHICGGNWSLSATECTAISIKNSPTAGRIPGTNFYNKGAFNPKYVTVRLVYSEP